MPMSNSPITMVRHVQREASATWQITHGQHGYPVVDVFINHGGALQKIIPREITYVDDNTVEVMFSEPQTGFATVIV